MQIIHRCCGGLDVHKKLIVACLISLNEAGEFQKEIRHFTTMTKDLAVRRTSKMASGSRISCSMGCCERVLSHQLPNVIYANSRATAVRYWLNVRD